MTRRGPRTDKTMTESAFIATKAHCLKLFQREVRRGDGRRTYPTHFCRWSASPSCSRCGRLTTALKLVDPVLLPSPFATFRTLWEGMVSGKLGVDFLKTVMRTISSTAIAAVIAIPLGILLGSSERLYRSVEFLIDFFRSTPASAMFPLFLVLFGVGDRTKISVAAFGAASGDPVQRRLWRDERAQDAPARRKGDGRVADCACCST